MTENVSLLPSVPRPGVTHSGEWVTPSLQTDEFTGSSPPC